MKTTEEQKVKDTFLGSQHFGVVEGRAGALGWD